jgi:hypothetical protein
MAPVWRASTARGSSRHAAGERCPGVLLLWLSLLVLCAAGIVAGAAAVPVYPCLIQAEDYGAGGEGTGYHDTTPGNGGGAYRDDDVDIWAEEEGFFVMNTAPGEWLGYDFSVDSVDTEHYPIPVLLRVTADRRETWIGIGVDGTTPRTFPIWTTPGAWTTQVVQIPYPAVGQHQLRVVFPDGDVWLDSVQLADNHASGWGDRWGGDPGLAASAAPIAGCAPLTVRFSDRSRPFPMYNWQWNFGDGNASREQNPIHVYAVPGEYTVQFFAQAGSYWSGGPPFMWIALWGMETYPLTLGSRVTVYQPPSALPGQVQGPGDTDGDGVYEDINGNGRTDFADVVLFFDWMDWIAANGPAVAFDQNGNNRIDFDDVVRLFNDL